MLPEAVMATEAKTQTHLANGNNGVAQGLNNWVQIQPICSQCKNSESIIGRILECGIEVTIKLLDRKWGIQRRGDYNSDNQKNQHEFSNPNSKTLEKKSTAIKLANKINTQNMNFFQIKLMMLMTKVMTVVVMMLSLPIMC